MLFACASCSVSRHAHSPAQSFLSSIMKINDNDLKQCLAGLSISTELLEASEQQCAQALYSTPASCPHAMTVNKIIALGCHIHYNFKAFHLDKQVSYSYVGASSFNIHNISLVFMTMGAEKGTCRCMKGGGGGGASSMHRTFEHPVSG